ncbi:MAG: L-serine ammonia-lyase [bacterium]|nr:L-serine ammonia-lyase [bacterium]
MISIFELFTIGIGPSSSHTVGPMRAAKQWLESISEPVFERITRVDVFLHGSLALTGKGHGTDKAIVLGLLGETPEDVVSPDDTFLSVLESGQLSVLGEHNIAFKSANIRFVKREKLPGHANGMRFVASDELGVPLSEAVYYSIGGGFVVSELDLKNGPTPVETYTIPHVFSSGADLLAQAKQAQKTIAELVCENEQVRHTNSEIELRLDAIWNTMQDCVSRGARTEGILPGGLDVKRRAAALRRNLEAHTGVQDPAAILDWVSMFALAVNEENAAGGRVVTAPTNGAAGIIPAVLHYYDKFVSPVGRDELRTFFFTAGAIGILYKTNASISGAEMGCQGEVGVACSMAAGGLAALMGGTPIQIESAAEIGMEHNLGLTCDPIKGLVQIPCIERNTMGAVKAINAARLALRGDGSQKVSLDKVIRTMKITGEDMKSRYKETSQGGLAINVVEC